eukprot:TRINITY_DN14192_c0_g1_i1.p1 TRINITY_DN14192_c0_g1~~TRINITY_DN14192_c0_g1_i1.p1  ORF type:complete len:243 (-),score=62.05 TRINITY_DN14192_c0_g1_i1:50-778(-)
MKVSRAVLLISSSYVHGSGYLEHCQQQIRDLLGAAADFGGTVAFVPYALADHEDYAQRAEGKFAEWGYKCVSVHRAQDPRDAVQAAKAIFIGGGNTFRLLNKLQETGLVQLIRKRVFEEGLKYIGTSAGSNVACPTIMTTNDMPIVQPQSFQACALVPFQINAHYIDADASTKHMGETREQRLAQYHEENDCVVIGLREGAMLCVRDDIMTLLGCAGAKVFMRGQQKPIEYAQGDDLSQLLL